MIHRLLTMATVAGLGIAILFVSTDPERLPPAVFIGFFLLFFMLCYSLLALLGVLLRRLEVIGWSRRRILRTSAAIACLPVFLLVLQSIGQLTFKDVLLTVGLFSLLYIYFGRIFIQSTQE